MPKASPTLPTPKELEFYRSKAVTGSYIGRKQLAHVFMALDDALDRAKRAEDRVKAQEGQPVDSGDMEYIDVPVEAAKKVSDAYCKDQVIIITWDNKHQLMHCTTYGKSLRDSALAAAGGARLKAWLGFPHEYCNALPARVLKAVAEYEAAHKG